MHYEMFFKEIKVVIELHATFTDYEMFFKRICGEIVVRGFKTLDRAEKQPRRML